MDRNQNPVSDTPCTQGLNPVFVPGFAFAVHALAHAPNQQRDIKARP